jgi:hypothetical protein
MTHGEYSQWQSVPYTYEPRINIDIVMPFCFARKRTFITVRMQSPFDLNIGLVPQPHVRRNKLAEKTSRNRAANPPPHCQNKTPRAAPSAPALLD